MKLDLHVQPAKNLFPDDPYKYRRAVDACSLRQELPDSVFGDDPDTHAASNTVTGEEFES